MKRLFALAVLLSTPLAWQCFASELGYDFVDSEEKKFYVGASVSALGSFFHERGGVIGGYNYAQNTQAELEVMLDYPLKDLYAGSVLANLRYSHKIMDCPTVLYFGVGIGISRYFGKFFDNAINEGMMKVARMKEIGSSFGMKWYDDQNSRAQDFLNLVKSLDRSFLVNKIKVGAEYQVTSKMSVFSGYRFFKKIPFSEEGYRTIKGLSSHELEVGVSYNF